MVQIQKCDICKKIIEKGMQRAILIHLDEFSREINSKDICDICIINISFNKTRNK